MRKPKTKADLEQACFRKDAQLVKKDERINMLLSDIEEVANSRAHQREKYDQSQNKVIALQEQLSVTLGALDRAREHIRRQGDLIFKANDDLRVAGERDLEMRQRLECILALAHPSFPWPPDKHLDAEGQPITPEARKWIEVKEILNHAHLMERVDEEEVPHEDEKTAQAAYLGPDRLGLYRTDEFAPPASSVPNAAPDDQRGDPLRSLSDILDTIIRGEKVPGVTVHFLSGAPS